MGKTQSDREFERAEKLVHSAVSRLCDAARILGDHGFIGPSRKLANAAHDAAVAISGADHERAALAAQTQEEKTNG